MIIELFLSLAGFFLGLLLSYLFMPFVMRSAKEAQMVTTDAHKPGKPEITEPGGLGALLAFMGAFSVIVLLTVVFYYIMKDPSFYNSLSFLNDANFQRIISEFYKDKDLLLGILLSVVIAGFLGFLDDIFGITFKWRHKILLGFLPAIPLMILRIGTPSATIPFLGVFSFGLWYGLIIVPLETNFGFNSVNMLAGYNGLETGMGIVSFVTVFLAASWVDNYVIMVFTATMIGTLLILFYFNKYPAKTLIGDSGTLFIGTALIVSIIVANMERLAIFVFLLYFINFALFFVYLKTKQTKKLADIYEASNGKVYLRPACPYAVYWILPFYKNITEKENVYMLIGLQTIICFIGLIVFIIIN